MCSSVVEHGIADPMVAGSIPVAPFFLFFVNTNVHFNGQYGRVVKASDSKSDGLCPRGFKSYYCRTIKNFCFINFYGPMV